MEVDLLIDRFDKDGDGELDLEEFTAFINAEVNPKLGDSNTTKTGTNHRGALSSSNPSRSRALMSSARSHVADEGKAEDDFVDDDKPPNFDDTANDVEDRTTEIRLRLSASSTQAQNRSEGFNNTDKTSVADYNQLSGTGSSMNLASIVNPAELSQIFAHQAKIEAKLGAKYFK